jgi:hypothetical protein
MAGQTPGRSVLHEPTQPCCKASPPPQYPHVTFTRCLFFLSIRFVKGTYLFYFISTFWQFHSMN